MTRHLRSYGFALMLAVTASMTVVVPATAAPATAQATAPTAVSTGLVTPTWAPVAEKSKPKKNKNRPPKYSPKTGVVFNEPYNRGGENRAAVRNGIIRSVDAVKKGESIHFASWNLRGAAYRDALIRAHRRGVTVRVIVDVYNANKERPNPDVESLRAEFRKKKNTKRSSARRSKLKKCSGSCRGGRGIPHQKFFLYSKAGKSRWVTQYSSNNATDIAVVAQWNDLFTVAENKTVYRGFKLMFDQMWKDKRRKNPFHEFRSGRMKFSFYPYQGKGAAGDPDLKKLNQVTCTGATGGTGVRGRTRIRMAQDALLGERGIRIAKKLVRLRKAGCDIRIVYALLGRQVKGELTRGKVPIKQYSYDRDRDGLYDIYLHMKAMAISGNYAGKSNNRVVYNGTANWTPKALLSDEVVGEIRIPKYEKRYANWVDFLFTNRPPSWGPINLGPCRAACATAGIDRAVLPRGAVAPKYDPYAWMKEQGL